MTSNIDLLDIFLKSSFIVQLAMIVLVLASILSWTLIYQISSKIRKNNSVDKKFSKAFWKGVNFDELYEKSKEKKYKSGLEHIFMGSIKSYKRILKTNTDDISDILDVTQRSINISVSKSVEHLEKGLSILAIIYSATPYIGLFGTVWGIMSVFLSLGSQEQVSLQLIAPGISEALIATALGLFAAIPALIFHNLFAKRIDKIENSYYNFGDELISILQYISYKNLDTEETNQETQQTTTENTVVSPTAENKTTIDE